MLNYCQPTDIADRVLRRKPHWFHGPPSIALYGQVKTFGELRFNFGNQIVTLKIWIKDPRKILDAANFAITNFCELIEWDED